MENNNGRGIFYGVIGVATLVVTIIGATFAYFTATANSNVDAVTAAGGSVSLTYNEDPAGLKSNLIPVAAASTNFNNIVGKSGTSCQDRNMNNVCSVYEFTIGNASGNPAQRIYASLKVQSNEFTTGNLKFAIYKGTAANVAASTQLVNGTGKKGSEAVAGDLVVPMTTVTATGTSIDLGNLEEVLNPGATSAYTVVLWINETGAAQNGDQGKRFAGGIFFTTETGSDDNKTGITGVLGA